MYIIDFHTANKQIKNQHFCNDLSSNIITKIMTL